MEQEVLKVLLPLLENHSTLDVITSLEHIIVQQYQKLSSQKTPLPSTTILSKESFKSSLLRALECNSFFEFSMQWIDSQWNDLLLKNDMQISNDSLLHFATHQVRILESISQKYQLSIPQQWNYLQYLFHKLLPFSTQFESIDNWIIDTLILFFSQIDAEKQNLNVAAQVWLQFPNIHPWDFLVFILYQWKNRGKWNWIKKLIWFSKENSLLHPLLKQSFVRTFVSSQEELTVETVWIQSWLMNLQKLLEEVSQTVLSKQISATSNQEFDEKQVLCLLMYWFDSFLLASEEELDESRSVSTAQNARLRVDKLPTALQETLRSIYGIFGK